MSGVSCSILSFVFSPFLLVQCANLLGPISIDFTTRQCAAVCCGVLQCVAYTYIYIYTYTLRTSSGPDFILCHNERVSCGVSQCVVVCCSVSQIYKEPHNTRRSSPPLKKNTCTWKSSGLYCGREISTHLLSVFGVETSALLLRTQQIVPTRSLTEWSHFFFISKKKK